MGDEAETRPPTRKGRGSAVAHQPARIRVRLAAGGLDLVLVLLATMMAPQPIPLIVPIGIFVVYHATLTWWLGRTIGKGLLGLRVLRPGREVTLWWSLARSGPGYLLFALAGLGLVTAAFDGHRRTLYDLALGGIVVQETDVTLRPRGIFDRLVAYAEEHKRTAAERKKSLGALTVLWVWLSGLGQWFLRPLNWLRGEQAPAGPSVLKVVSGKVAAVSATAATAAAAIVVTTIPQARDVGEWLLTERYWVGQEQPSTPSNDAIADWMVAQDEPYVGACPDPGTVADRPVSWCTLGPRTVTVSEEPGLAEFGAATGELFVLGQEGWYDSFWAELVVIEASDGWRVAAIRQLGTPGDLDDYYGPWLSPDVGVWLGHD